MAEAPDVKVSLTAEDTGVASAIKELVSNLKTLKAQEEDTASSALSLAGAFNALVSSAVVFKLIQFGKATLDAGVSIEKMTQKTGLSAKTLSVFHKTADDLGISSQTVDKGIVRLTNTITKYEQGNTQAAIAMQQLGLTQKDFNGLNSDQKLLLVTNALGRMKDSFTKAGLAQQLLSRGGTDLIPVMNQLAGQGFDKATESARQLGLLMDQDMVDSAAAAAAALKEVEDVGKGMATQFEAGLLPAIADVTDSLTESSVKGGDGFKKMGEIVGEIVRGIVFVLEAVGIAVSVIASSIEEDFTGVFREIKTVGTSVFEAMGQAAHGNFSAAALDLKQGVINSLDVLQDESKRADAVLSASFEELKKKYADIFPSADDEAARQKARAAKIKGDGQDADEPKPPALPQTNEASKARVAQLERQMQDELAIYRAGAAQREQADKFSYEEGQISLSEYYDRRRTELTNDTQKEIAILQHEREVAQAAADVAGKDAKTAPTQQGKDKLDAERIANLTKVDDLNAKIAETQIAATTKQQGLDNEQFKAQDEANKKVLEFQAQILLAQGKTYEAAIAKIHAEAQETAIALEQAGLSPSQVAALTAQITAAKTAAANYEEEQKVGESALKELADQRAAIEDRVKDGQLFQSQAVKQIEQLEKSRLATLQQIASATLAAAQATGDEAKIQQAKDLQKQVDQVGAEADIAGQHMATLRETVEGSLTSSFSNFFDTVGRGNDTIGESFAKLAGSVVQSLEKMAAKMLATLLIQKLLTSQSQGGDGSDDGGGQQGGNPNNGRVLGSKSTAQTLFGFFGKLLGSFTGSLSGSGSTQGDAGGDTGGGDIFGDDSSGGVSAAGGGLISGPGTPTSDSISAMLSDGEYVLQSKAVKRIGVHALDAINKGLHLPVSHAAVHKFSEGGLVGAGGGAGLSDLHLGLTLDEGLVLKHLSSKSAGRIILNHLANNPKAAGKALSRSQ